MNSNELIINARLKKECVPAFNTYNLETIQAGFEASKIMNEPIILAFGEGYLKYTSLEVISALVKELSIIHEIPMVLHLDHCKDIRNIEKAINLGFKSVMYDGSHLSLTENIRNTQLVVNMAHEKGVSVEGELGGLNSEDGNNDYSNIFFTDASQAKEYVQKTNVDTLAVSVGNAHGVYKGTPKIDFELLKDIYETVNIPIVLHGCSGIPKEDLIKAINLAVAKINVNTDLALGASKKVKELLNRNPKLPRFEVIMNEAKKEIVRIMNEFIKICKSSNGLD